MKKKLIPGCAGILCCFTAGAQSSAEPLVDRSLIFDVVNICAAVLVLYIIAGLVVKLVQQYLDNRLKKRMLDAGTPETVIVQLIQKRPVANRTAVLQWICVLVSLSIALFIIDAMGPVTLVSLAVLAACIALGLLAHYLLTKKQP